MNDYLLSLLSAHVELTSARVIEKMEADLDAQDLLARYHGDRSRKEAIRKALDYLAKTGKATRTSVDGVNYWSVPRAASIPPLQYDPDTAAFAATERASATISAPEPTDNDDPHYPLDAALLHALLHPIKGQVEPHQAQRWSRVCEALAASPLLHDSIAKELDDISHYFTNHYQEAA